MNLRSGYPFSFVKNGYFNSYPVLSDDIVCDVAIIGGGITGALCAYYLHKGGASVAVVDKRHIGMGSTCASTSILQYELDQDLTTLIKKVGINAATTSYILCHEAIDKLKTIADLLPVKTDFEYKKSLYLASSEKDIAQLEYEYLLRKSLGINLKLLNRDEVINTAGFTAPAALLSEQGGQTDAYLFTHGIFSYIVGKGCRVFDSTRITGILESKQKAILLCSNGKKIICRKFVFATGYESQLYMKRKRAQIHSTYAIISKPVSATLINQIKFVIWESARPYIYIRSTIDNRIIAGGKDEMFYNPKKRNALTLKKSLLLRKAILNKYPYLPFVIDFAWAGSFAETKDGLPYIGQAEQYRHGYFALGFGGNGITFAQIAGEIISELFHTGRSRFAHLFSLSR